MMNSLLNVLEKLKNMFPNKLAFLLRFSMNFKNRDSVYEKRHTNHPQKTQHSGSLKKKKT